MMNSKELVNLLYSPQWVGKLQHHFLSGASRTTNKNGIKIELIYLLLPFVIDEVTRMVLLKKNIKSTYENTFLRPKELAVKNSLLIKGRQIKEFKSFTNSGIIFLNNKVDLNVSTHISIQKTIKYNNENKLIRDYCKSAHNFGIILGKSDYKSVFIDLGVDEI